MEEERLRDLWSEARELTLGPGPAIPNLPSPPTPLRFLREFVSQNKPCLISSSSASSWPALRRWAHTPYLLRRLSSSSSSATVSLHLTPSGRADSLAPHPSHPTSSLCFASPAVVSLPFSRAIRLIEDDNNSGVVAYAQQQNDCFRLEYGGVAGDVEGEMEWAREAFGGDGPEAVNLWIGNGRSETAFHKDHYENLYVVVTGQKHFLLLPPTEVHRMYIRNYPAAVYKTGENCFDLRLELEEPERLVPWCSVDPYPRSLEEMERQRKEFPMYFEGPKPFEVTVKAGEILYLPSMWFHHVRQSPDENGRTIAINYWYDMQFDIKYAYFNFLQSINCRPTASLANGPAEDTCENDFKPNMSS